MGHIWYMRGESLTHNPWDTRREPRWIWKNMENLWRMGEIFQLSAVRGESTRSGTEDKEADSSTYKMQVNNEPAKTKTKPKPRSPKETESVQWAWCRRRCQSQWRWPPKMWHLSHVVILRRLHIKWVSSRTILSPRRPILWARSLSKPYIKRFRKK